MDRACKIYVRLEIRVEHHTVCLSKSSILQLLNFQLHGSTIRALPEDTGLLGVPTSMLRVVSWSIAPVSRSLVAM